MIHLSKCGALITNRYKANLCKTFLRNSRTCDFFRHNLTFSFHTSPPNPSKLFIDIENSYAYKLLPQIPKIQPSWKPQNQITTIEDFNCFLDQNWRASTASSIVEAFEKVKDITVLNNFTLSDHRFDKLVDGLMDNCEKLTDDELLRLMLTLLEYPPCEASNSHNFHDIWSCLDDICCWKMSDWGVMKLYTFVEIWYKWNLGRLSDFVFEALDRALKKPQRLTKNMLLYTFFYLNVNRRRSVPFDFEHVLAERISEFSVDELAVIAMGYFKTKTKIKLAPILNAMIKAIGDNYESINEISLAAMLKVIRLSQHLETVDKIPPLMDQVMTQIPRFSIMCLIHVALIGTSLQIKHEPSLRKCAERMLQEIEDIRLKDIERMILVCSMFDVDTNPSLFEAAQNEVLKESRRPEFIQYTRCLPSILYYLCLRKIYPLKLISEVLDEDYINETYGKSAKNLPRDLYCLDNSVDIECPNYTGNRLPAVKKYKAVKWQTEFTPRHNQSQRLSLSDKAYLEITDLVQCVVREERFLRHDHVLPHFSKSDIILCKDRASGEFVEPKGFENYVLGDIKRPPDVDKFEWFAVMVMTSNLTVRGTNQPLGTMITKERQLKAIGYKPIPIYTSFSPEDRVSFLHRQLS